MAKFKAKVTDFEAEDIRAFYDSSVLRVWHLEGRDKTFKIVKIQRIETEFMGEGKKRPLITLETEKGKLIDLPFELNPTNRKTIQQMYGTKVRDWIGKWITLFVATGIDTPQGPSDAIRVRNSIPKTKTKGAGAVGSGTVQASAPVDDDGPSYREPGQDDDEPPSEVELPRAN